MHDPTPAPPAADRATATAAVRNRPTLCRTSPRAGRAPVAGGGASTCGLRSDGAVTCWGNNAHGQAEAPAGRFEVVIAGGGHMCGLRSDDTVTCWGWNATGQTDAPTGQFRAVTAGWAHSCGLRGDGIITCWGGTLVGASPGVRWG